MKLNIKLKSKGKNIKMNSYMKDDAKLKRLWNEIDNNQVGYFKIKHNKETNRLFYHHERSKVITYITPFHNNVNGIKLEITLDDDKSPIIIKKLIPFYVTGKVEVDAYFFLEIIENKVVPISNLTIDLFLLAETL